MRVLILLVLGSCLMLGCAARRAPPSQLPVVASINFEGNGNSLSGTGDYSLRAAMEQGENPALSFLAPRRRKVPLVADTLATDGWRLEVWYAHHGYFDARFLGWDVITVRPARRRRAATVRIVGHVDPGRASVVRTVQWRGVEAESGPLTRLLERTTEPAPGARFDLDALHESQVAALSRLQDSSFARVSAELAVEVHPEDQVVDVAFDVDTGPACRIGPVQVVPGSGVLTIDPELLSLELTFEEGDAYKASELASTRRRLYGLGVFSTVVVEPILEPQEGVPLDVVPVRVSLTQAKSQQLRLGGGLNFESGKQEVHVVADYRHVNVLNRLVRLSLTNQVGYAVLGAYAQLQEAGFSLEGLPQGPTVDSTLNIRVPRFPSRSLSVEMQAAFRLGVETGYRFASPSVGPALHWRISRRTTGILSYKLTYFDYLPGDLELGSDTELGLDGTDPYLLSALTQQIIVDRRDDLLMPRRGSYGVFSIDEAGGPFGGGYNFVRFQADQRLYIPLVRFFGLLPRGTFALRGVGGTVATYGPEAKSNVPYAERLYLGGSTTVRGWTRNRLGPYSFACSEPGSEGTCYSSPDESEPTGDITPIGGLHSLMGSAELRAYPWGSYGFAVFSDAGLAWNSASDFWSLGVLPTVGVGGRYRSPIGPIRLDLAFRLDQKRMFDLEPRFNVHFSLAEAF